ncbi:MAG: GGDEF domain-containing protein [Nitrospirae bacterium]|nr:GGDEF domain-containing protein [Nitrospirota bacterium]
MKKNDAAECDYILKRIHEEILPLMDKAISDDSVLFNNDNLKTCWEEKNCDKEVCPVHSKNEHLRCWQIAGTYCGGKVQGFFAEKYKNCKACDIYTAACPTVVEELGEGLNNLLFLIRKQKRYNAKQLEEINHLNNELSSAIENLDTKNRAIQEMVITDKLTGLYNRNYLFTVLEDEISRCQRYNTTFSIFMIDIDDFKRVNDEFGHLVGDKLLASLGDVVKKVIRNTDRPFRYGGEEFVIILPETEPSIAIIIANRIRTAFEATIIEIDDGSGKKNISRTLSLGVAFYKKGATSQELLKQADTAMYTAKAEGKNKVIRFDFLD